MANVLLLQGPMGWFFHRFAQELRAAGLTVYKIHLNGGEELYYRGREVLRYTEPVENWPAYLNRTLEQLSIKQVYLYSDCRIYHRLAREVCAEKGIPVYCFEEGYIRPNYITLDCHGVHANANIPKQASAFPPVLHKPDKQLACGSTLMEAVQFCAVYYWGGVFYRWRYRHYRHHRYFGPIYAGWGVIMRGLRFLTQSKRDRKLENHIQANLRGKYFFIPLQVYDDAQVTEHSNFGSVERFIETVLHSFAEHAPKDTHLVIKHHPLETRLSDHQLHIGDIANKLGIFNRVHYIHHLHLPTILQQANGVITINSTVGLSALYHGTPVKPLGNAIYDVPGLSYQGELADFWNDSGQVDNDLLQRFRNYLLTETQANGNFYKPLPGLLNPTGIRWNKKPWMALADDSERMKPSLRELLNDYS